ncbi:MAG: laminin G domain-containing protein [Kiritimatiellae bacterium]|nr:laminin G domain-containing protein [Kiritimatiellia bacterium]
MKGTILAVAASAILPLCADTIGWWRFSQGDGTTITNAADAATFTGTLKSITTAGASPTYGDDSSQFPTWNAGFSDKADILDPVTKTVRPATGALRWNMGETKSGLVIPTTSGDALHGNTFTVEMFYRMPTGGTNPETGPYGLYFLGRKNVNGCWIGWYQNNRIYARVVQASHRSMSTPTNVLRDGRWHHIALVSDNGTLTLYTDYVQCATGGVADDPMKNIGTYPLVIGANPYDSTDDSFPGDIAEVRVSDTVLTKEQFLRPVSKSWKNAVDEDTAVYLTFDESTWFGTGLYPATDIAAKTPVFNSAFNSDLFAEWVDVRNRNTAQLSPGDPVAAELRSNTLAADTYENTASMHFATNGTGYGPAVNIPGAAQLSTNSVTIEFFFKMPQRTVGGTVDIVNTPFLKFCTTGTDGDITARCYFGSAYGGGTHDLKINGTAADEWHHAAFVYDRSVTTNTCRLYIDYTRLRARTETLYEGTAAEYFFIGALGQGTSQNAQPFNGWMDEVRITRRALRPDEFLTPRPFMSDRAMDCVFAGDLATSQDAVIAPAGTVTDLTDGSHSFATLRGGKVAVDGETGAMRRDFGQSVVLDNALLRWQHNSILEQRNLTVEFFAKINEMTEERRFLDFRRLLYDDDTAARPVWQVTFRGNPRRLITISNTSADGSTDNRTEHWSVLKEGDIADGKWHHWALTVLEDASGVSLVLYRDYEEYGRTHASNEKWVMPTPWASEFFMFADGGMKGAVSNLRVTPRVLAPSEFMHFLPSGFMVIFK